MNPVFAAVADDDTGATDLAGMLAGQGLKTVLVIDVPPAECLYRWSEGHDAVIVGAGTRALAPSEAYDRSRAAVRLLRNLGPRVIEVKYCSTFDSTPEGNIGPSIDAAMDELGEIFTVALPALPVNGRTTYMGRHFVNGQLLSDSPMRQHPLTPMTNPNLVSHLQTQTRRRVGLAEYPVTPEKLARLQAEGVQIAVLDCIGDSDLENVCESIAGLRLITGSSAPAMKLPCIWQRDGWWKPSSVALRRPVSGAKGFLVVAGSCSVATQNQNRWLETQGAHTITLDARDLLADSDSPGAVSRAVTALASGRTCLLQTKSSADDVLRVREWANTKGLSAGEAGLRIAYALAGLVRRIVEESPPAALIVAGGETSGAICRTLELGALEIGQNIEPGVPICVSLGRFRMPVALKSGNFGSDDFYGRAIAASQTLS